MGSDGQNLIMFDQNVNNYMDEEEQARKWWEMNPVIEFWMA